MRKDNDNKKIRIGLIVKTWFKSAIELNLYYFEDKTGMTDHVSSEQ